MMAKSRTFNINGIGPILLEHSARAKRIAISIRPQKGVRVAVPTGTSFNKALEFVYLKQLWIRKHLAIIEHYEDKKKALENSILAIDRLEAKRILTERLQQLAHKHRFTYNKASIRNQTTRWGSCSHKKNISLNMKLMMLPAELMDYVLMHELVHTRIHNHSKKFWAELDKYVGDRKAMASSLRKYGLGLL